MASLIAPPVLAISPFITAVPTVNGMSYQVVETREVPIPFKKIFTLSRTAPLGRTSVAHTGVNGVLDKTYRITYRNATAVRYDLISTKVVKAPVDFEVVAGYTREARALPSRSGVYNRCREIDMVATGYSPYEGSGAGLCANGMHAGFGLVAVDPRVIPLGTHLYVEGYGYALAGDTGGAIRGARIDLGQDTYSAAEAVGRRRVHVYILANADGR
jgi:3D (Asp-Asp-Asp) domain-containing protein